MIVLIGKMECFLPPGDLLGMWRHLASQVYAQGYSRRLCTAFFFCLLGPDKDTWNEKGGFMRLLATRRMNKSGVKT
jgi:hypothetical protein